MPADVLIRELNGVSPGTPTDKTDGTIQFKVTDDPTVESPIENPVIIPPSGSAYSYEKALRLRIGATGPTNEIDSPRAYNDGSVVPGGTNFLLKNGRTGVYSQPVITNSPNTGALWVSYPPTNPFAIDLFNPGPYSGTNVDIADFLYFQLEVLDTAVTASAITEGVLVAYDED